MRLIDIRKIFYGNKINFGINLRKTIEIIKLIEKQINNINKKTFNYYKKSKNYNKLLGFYKNK